MKKRFFVAIISSCLFAVLFIGLNGMFGENVGERIVHWDNFLNEAREHLAEELTQDQLRTWHDELVYVIQNVGRGRRWYADTEIEMRGTTVDAGEEFSRLERQAEKLRDEVLQRLEDDELEDEDTDEEDGGFMGVDWNQLF